MFKKAIKIFYLTEDILFDSKQSLFFGKKPIRLRIKLKKEGWHGTGENKENGNHC